MEKPVIQYTIRPQANRASGGVINVPAIIGREDSVPLELIVDRAIDRGLIVAIKPNAAKSVADGVAKQMFEEFRNGNGVKFGDYFYARLYLDGTTDGSGTLVEGRNGINVRLYKGNGFKLGLKDFSWQFAEAENIAAIDYLVSDADGAQRGILLPGAVVLLNGTQLMAEDDDAVKVLIRQVVEEGEAGAEAEVAEFVSAGPNLLSFALPAELPHGAAYTAQVARTRGKSTFLSNRRGFGIASDGEG